jgi:predicted transcriptional regulator
VRSFGELESAVMDRVWEADHPVRVRELLEQLHYEKSLALTTVLTVMERLYRKGWLAREKHGRAHEYWPTVSRADYAAGLMEEALEQGEDRAATLTRFVKMLDSREIDQLRRALGDAPQPLAAASF